jgi:hypothetical protein
LEAILNQMVTLDTDLKDFLFRLGYAQPLSHPFYSLCCRRTKQDLYRRYYHRRSELPTIQKRREKRVGNSLIAAYDSGLYSTIGDMKTKIEAGYKLPKMFNLASLAFFNDVLATHQLPTIAVGGWRYSISKLERHGLSQL